MHAFRRTRAASGRRMGHAGAIIEGGTGAHRAKTQALSAAGIRTVENLSQIGETVAKHAKELVA